MADEEIPVAERRALDHLVTIMVIAALTSWVCAAVAATRAPWVPDLYNLVYDNARPKRGEATAVFLFLFPGFLTFGSASVFAASRDWLWPRGSPDYYPLRVAFLTMWAGLFFVGSIRRSWIVYTYSY